MLSQFVLLPLYIYPTATTWQNLYNAASTNPNLPFYVVINPANGPGAQSSHPDSNWISGISQLNTYPNVRTLGYVHTTSATRNINDTITDIYTYANWSTYSGANIGMDGIFFDEAPSAFNTQTSTYMSTVASQARTALGAGRDYVVFNAGAHSPIILDSAFYAMADTIIVFEDYASAYNVDAVKKITPALRSQSAFILHDFSGSSSEQTTVTSKIVGNGVTGVYITDSSSYAAWGSMWSAFTTAMSNAKLNSMSTAGSTVSGTTNTVTGGTKKMFKA